MAGVSSVYIKVGIKVLLCARVLQSAYHAHWVIIFFAISGHSLIFLLNTL